LTGLLALWLEPLVCVAKAGDDVSLVNEAGERFSGGRDPVLKEKAS